MINNINSTLLTALNIFEFRFMQVAFVVGILLAITIPLIGTSVVFKRLSMTGDALSHTSLAGVAIGLLFGYNPLIIAMITSIIAALIIELMRKKFSKYSEMSIAIVLSTGIGLAGVLSSFTPMANFSTYLFGSIVAITNTELYLTIAVFLVVTIVSVLFYKELMFISYNEENAKISKVPVNAINILFTVLTAITIAIASRTIGALIVSSLIVIPVATSMQLSKSYKGTMLTAILFSTLSVIIGLILSFYLGLKPGGTIILVNIVFLILALFARFIENKLNIKKSQKN